MSLESKQFFTQRKEIPPEIHQRGIRYAQELKAIRDKENPTREDLERVKELIEAIEMIFFCQNQNMKIMNVLEF